MTNDEHDDKRHDEKPHDQKPADPSTMMWALIGITIFIVLTFFYVSDLKKNAPPSEQEQLDKQTIERNKLLREWQSSGQKR